MRILVIGAGGREHALAWRIGRDAGVSEVLAAPGNPGISDHFRCFSVDPLNPAEVLALAERERVDLTVIGPEAPLERGVGNLFREVGRPIVGSSQRGAALECSKVHSKHFMAEQGIPTARFAVCETLDAALAAVDGSQFGFPVVVKADGLAAGKGVVVAADRPEAEQAVRAALVDGQFGAAGSRLVIEECLVGPEVSFFVLCDGDSAIPLSSAQDHKRIWDDDRGPNTGGMGAFAPSPLVDETFTADIIRRVVEPVLAGMKAAGEPYIGFLYVSLMLTIDGPKVIEFNVRFGDPEAQVVLPLLEGNFSQALLAAATGSLGDVRLPTSRDRTVGVVLASRGYPASSDPGRVIEGLDAAASMRDVLVFHSGTRLVDGRVVTAGGRVVTVVGRGASYGQAMTTAYAAADRITFEGRQCRRDIGRKAVQAEAGVR